MASAICTYLGPTLCSVAGYSSPVILAGTVVGFTLFCKYRYANHHQETHGMGERNVEPQVPVNDEVIPPQEGPADEIVPSLEVQILLVELEAFVNKTPFGQHNPDEQVELENESDFLPAFKLLSQKIQGDILKEMIVSLKEIDFNTEACKEQFQVETEEEAYQKFAEALLEIPYTDIEDLAPDQNLGSHLVVLEAIMALKLRFLIETSQSDEHFDNMAILPEE